MYTIIWRSGFTKTDFSHIMLLFCLFVCFSLFLFASRFCYLHDNQGRAVVGWTDKYQTIEIWLVTNERLKLYLYTPDCKIHLGPFKDAVFLAN